MGNNRFRDSRSGHTSAQIHSALDKTFISISPLMQKSLKTLRFPLIHTAFLAR
jgi:hypothetical protein